jgi:hypothetical protein
MQLFGALSFVGRTDECSSGMHVSTYKVFLKLGPRRKIPIEMLRYVIAEFFMKCHIRTILQTVFSFE